MVTKNGTVYSVRDYFRDVTSTTPVFTTHTQESINGEIVGLILSMESILIISTNILVAIALVLLIWKRGSQNWCFVLNLAVADILVGLAITALASYAMKGRLSSMNKELCLLKMAFVITPSTASILTMFFISLDRYIAIKLPLRYTQVMGTKTIIGALLCLWLISASIGFLPHMVEDMQHGDYESICTFFSVINPQSIIIVFCIVFFPILLVFIYFYLDILKIAWSHQRRIQQATQVNSSCVLPNRYWVHVKALKTVAVLIGCITLCWCPFFVVSVVQVLCPSCKLYRFLENHLWMLALSNSLINPLVYAFWQKEVRQQLCAIFSCIKASHCCSKASDASEGHGDQTIASQSRNELDHCQFIFRKPATIPFTTSALS
ncbi:glucose-dependent insulinotropic receptor [Trichomycterus rosablanca]|uniref:glucose-dependent insulinotropic receptor n=1 Tax=Trichomycterus rosablanca TaxID=2290929 RepID=UPI002F35CC3A